VAIDPGALAKSIEHLQGAGLVHDGVADTLQRIVNETARLFRVDGAGLMLLADDDHLRYVASSDERGRMLEKIHEQVGEGPCLSAFAAGKPQFTIDAPANPHWPAFGRLAAEHSIRSVMGVPVELSGGPIGTLNVYAVEPHQWDETEQDAIVAYARLTAVVLATLIEAEAKDALAVQLQQALDQRVVIEQAKGILMERHGIDAQVAFERLRRRARSRQERVVDLARRVVDGEPLPPG
jgi:GAF domain-containing protein